MTITSLPGDVLGCIIRHLQEDGWQRGRVLDDIAALRSVCRSLRLAIDLRVTHANFHANIRVADLRSMTRRFPGDQRGTSLSSASPCALASTQVHIDPRASILHTTLRPYNHTFHCVTSSQVCKQSHCSSLGPTPLPQRWRRWLLYNICGVLTRRAQDLATAPLSA